ncbi:MAG: YggS family pyridoxal phosphate-dependent enzyme, partial [Bacillota bacterium]
MDKNELEKRLENIKERIKRAAEKNKRDIDSISLVAVSKRHSLEKINLFADQGIHLFGESRVQELTDKYAKRPDLNWHFIGHLQRNKVKYLMRMENCKLIHSLDSWRLAKEINKRAKKNNRIMPLLLQVNVADEDSKYGITVEKANDFLTKAEKLENINIIGLMTMA